MRMEKLQEKERDIVRDALALLRQNTAKQHLEDVSKLPRNGKAVSDASSEAAEATTIGRLKDIDRVLGHLDIPEKDAVLWKPRRVDPKPHALDPPAAIATVDEEPYINPFTGQFVYPYSANAPGPSGSRSAAFSFKHMQQTSKAQKAVEECSEQLSRVPAVTGILHTVSGPNPVWTHSPRSSISSFPLRGLATSSIGDDSIDMRSDDLETLLSDFDDSFMDFEKRHTQSYVPIAQSVYNYNAKQEATSSKKNDRVSTMDPSPWDHHSMKALSSSPRAGMSQAGEERIQRFEDDQAIAAALNEKYMKQNNNADVKSPKMEEEWIWRFEEDETIAAALSAEYTKRHDDANAKLPQAEEQGTYRLENDEVTVASPDEDYQKSNNAANVDDFSARNPVESPPPELLNVSKFSDSPSLQVQQELLHIQQMIHQQDQEEMEAEMARLQKLEQDWNRTWEESIQEQKTLSSQLVELEAQEEKLASMREMRRLQRLFQDEEDRQIEADRALALLLSEETDSDQVATPRIATHVPVAPSRPPPAYTELQVDGEQQRSRTHGNADDELQTSYMQDDQHDSFRQAQLLHEQQQSEWRASIEDNARQAKAIQDTLDGLEAQARRDYEYLRQEQQRQRDEAERQRKEQEQRRRKAEQERLRQEELQRQEAERLREAEEQARKARIRTCAVCSEDFDQSVVYHFECKHAYCRGCLEQATRIAVKGKSPFRCCKNGIDILKASPFLPSALSEQYKSLIEELENPNPVYCSNRGCSTFIPRRSIKAGTATCPKCQRQTCSSCKQATHAGICKDDKDGQALLKLSNSKHWRKCPSCGNMVERSEGCLHMTCRCGKGFCYNCGKPSSACTGTCKRLF